MSHRPTSSMVAYDIVLALVCTTLIFLILVLLFLLCKRRSIEPEDNIITRPTIRAYTLTDIDAATDGFNQERILGKGRLGTVYGAVLGMGDVVAVKRVNPHLVLSNAGSSFSSTIRSLSSAHHPNIVPVIGFCEAPGERIIMMEFMGMHSLDHLLHQDQHDGSASGTTPLLDWKNRVRIAAEAARGIECLHEGTAPNIVHGSIKPCNIMIDLSFHARVSDYGLTFLAPQQWRGLVGYLDAEYWIDKGGVCKASDVFGFGVVLLELLSGRRCEEGLIVKWGLPLIKDSRVLELLDPRLGVPSSGMGPLVRLAKVASACVSNSRKSRPSIVQVAAILNSLEMEMEMEMEIGP